jgi:hypothetical protein
MTACTAFGSDSGSTGDEAFASAGIRFSFCLIGRAAAYQNWAAASKDASKPLEHANIMTIDRKVAKVA